MITKTLPIAFGARRAKKILARVAEITDLKEQSLSHTFIFDNTEEGHSYWSRLSLIEMMAMNRIDPLRWKLPAYLQK